MVVFLKYLLEKVNFENESEDDNKSLNIWPACKELSRCHNVTDAKIN